MRNLLVTGVVAAAASMAVFALSANPANARLQIAADFGGTLFTCFDNQASCDTNLSTGNISLATQTIGGILLDGSIQKSVGTVLTPGSQDLLNTSSLSAVNTLGVAVTYIVTVSDINFTGPVATFNTSGSGVVENGVGTTANQKWWADAANAQGADAANDTPGTLIDSSTFTATSVADSYSHNGAGAFVAAGAFSMTEQISGSIAANGTLLNRGQTEILTPAPEPASIALLGAGLLGLGAVVRRRR